MLMLIALAPIFNINKGNIGKQLWPFSYNSFCKIVPLSHGSRITPFISYGPQT